MHLNFITDNYNKNFNSVHLHFINLVMVKQIF